MDNTGDQDKEHQDLMQALENLPEDPSQNAFIISEGEMQAPEGLVNAPEGLVPEGLGNVLAEMPVDSGAAAPEGELPNFVDSHHPDPAMAVEEMLSAAIPAPEEILDPPALAEPASTPSFQVHLASVPPEARSSLKELAKGLGIEWNDSLILSQLTEFQALALHQGASSQGWETRVTVKFPLPGLTEDEMALGDLAQVAESDSLASEGAPAVELPAREKDVLLFSEDNAPAGLLWREGRGMVSAHRSVARRFFREEEAQEKLQKELAKFPGKAAALPSSRLENLFRELFLDLQKSALAKGANCVLGLRLEAFQETSSLDPTLEQLRLVAIGTAAVVEKA